MLAALLPSSRGSVTRAWSQGSRLLHAGFGGSGSSGSSWKLADQSASKALTLYRKRTKAVALYKRPVTALVDPRHEMQKDFDESSGRKLVYGLENHEAQGQVYGRARLRMKWSPRIDNPATTSHPFSKSLDGMDTKGLTTVDTFNNQSWREFPFRGAMKMGPFGAYGKHLSQTQLETALSVFRVGEGKGAKLSKRDMLATKDFQTQLLQHPRYSPLATREEDPIAHMKKEGISDPTKALFRAQTIRACKFGIEYGQMAGGRVMFELGGMHTPDAASKKSVGRKSSTGEQLRSITNAELRKAFRSDHSDKSMSFYRDGKRVAAPWASAKSEEGQSWMSYATKRAQKYQAHGLVPDYHKVSAAVHTSGLRDGLRELNKQVNTFRDAMPTKHSK